MANDHTAECIEIVTTSQGGNLNEDYATWADVEAAQRNGSYDRILTERVRDAVANGTCHCNCETTWCGAC